MAEFKFVLKSFLMAIVLMMLLQIKVGPQTLEAQAEEFLQRSALSQYLQEVASGAVLAGRNAMHNANEFISKKMGHESSTTQGSRLSSMEIKRSNPSSTETKAQR